MNERMAVKIPQLIISAIFLVSVFIAFAGTVRAVDYGGGSVQGYSAEQPLDFGTIVKLADRDKRIVAVAAQNELENMFGVVVDPQILPIRLSSGDLTNETYVAVSGTYNVLVSSQGGDINAGDYITLSSVNGVGMKAGTEEASVIGRAVGGFDENSVIRGTAEVKDVDGNLISDVKLGSIPMTIEIQSNPNEKSTEVNVPEVLKRVGQAIAEREVSAVRIYISMAITAVSLITALTVLYIGVRSSVISIGRNPMSKKSIFRALLEVILTSAVILVIGLFAVYLLLRL